MEFLIYFFLFILGASVGSFLNVLIDRLPQEKSINGRSICDHCHHQLAWYDLIPIVSFFLLGGKCRYCNKKISWYYPLVEFLTGASFVFIFLKDGPFFERSVLLMIISCLIVIFFSDLKYQIIPDSIQIAFFIFSLLFKLTEILGKGCVNISFFHCFIIPLLHFFIAGVVVMLPIFFLWLTTNGRGMGFGDVKLAFNIGFFLGIKAGFLTLYFAFVIGGIVGLILIFLGRKKLKSKIAFGPFLVVGMLIMLFFKKEVFEIIDKIYGV